MNPVILSEAEKLFNEISQGVKKSQTQKTEIVICPPFVWLKALSRKLKAKDRKLKLGAQDVFYKQKGAYTGEISPLMLKDLGAEYVIIGHSERRKFLKEKEGMLNKKIKAALKVGLNPIFCVGNEKLKRPQNIQELNRIKTQLSKGLRGIGSSQMNRMIIAYEPVWAIGTDFPATPHYATSIVKKVRLFLSRIFSQKIAREIPVLYGGSTNAENAPLFVAEKEIDGLLVGGASLEVQEFTELVRNIALINK